MAKLEPGTVCFIVNSVSNDGKIVTLAKFLGDKNFRRQDGGPNTVFRAWLINEPLDKGPGPLSGPTDVYTVPEFNLKPLDNPGDDEVDTHSLRLDISNIRKLEHHG